MSSTEDKDTSVAQLAKSVQTLVERITPSLDAKPQEEGFKKWANTPFVVTLVGGLLGTLLTQGWQFTTAYYAQKATKLVVKREQAQKAVVAEIELRNRAASDFMNLFPGALARLYDYHDTMIWIASAKSTNDVHASGRKYFEMWRRSEEIDQQRTAGRSAAGFPPQIVGTFTNASIHKAALELQAVIQRMDSAQSKDDLDRSLEQQDPLYDFLIREMTLETVRIQTQLSE